MSKSVHTHREYLRALCKLKPYYRNILVKAADADAIKCICECIFNVLKGSVPITEKEKLKLRKHKKVLRELIKKGDLKKKRKIIIQTGGAFLPIVLGSLLSGVLSSLLK